MIERNCFVYLKCFLHFCTDFHSMYLFGSLTSLQYKKTRKLSVYNIYIHCIYVIVLIESLVDIVVLLL